MHENTWLGTPSARPLATLPDATAAVRSTSPTQPLLEPAAAPGIDAETDEGLELIELHVSMYEETEEATETVRAVEPHPPVVSGSEFVRAGPQQL
eukprot:evm.model.NODE_1214_length_7623_cov_21.711794.2